MKTSKTKRKDGHVVDDEVKLYCANCYIEHLRSIEMSMKVCTEELQIYKDRLDIMGISYDSVKVSGSHHQTNVADGVIEVINRIDDMVAHMAYQNQEVTEARKIFNQLEQKESYALKAYCFLGKTWVNICKELSYKNYGSVMKLRKRALINLYPLMPEEWRRCIPKAV